MYLYSYLIIFIHSYTLTSYLYIYIQAQHEVKVTGKYCLRRPTVYSWDIVAPTPPPPPTYTTHTTHTHNIPTSTTSGTGLTFPRSSTAPVGYTPGSNSSNNIYYPSKNQQLPNNTTSITTANTIKVDNILQNRSSSQVNYSVNSTMNLNRSLPLPNTNLNLPSQNPGVNFPLNFPLKSGANIPLTNNTGAMSSHIYSSNPYQQQQVCMCI